MGVEGNLQVKGVERYIYIFFVSLHGDLCSCTA